MSVTDNEASELEVTGSGVKGRLVLLSRCEEAAEYSLMVFSGILY